MARAPTRTSNLSPRQQAGVAAGGVVATAITAIIAAVFAVEGGYVNNRNDPGGATNHGVTEQTARADGYTGRMQDLPKERAAEIMERNYITKPGFGPIIERSAAIGEEMVDTGYNAGTGRAARWFQESLNLYNDRGRLYPDVVVDGDIGPATLRTYDALVRHRGSRLACELVIKALDGKQAAHYMRLAGTNTKFEEFTVGWFRTRIENVDRRGC